MQWGGRRRAGGGGGEEAAAGSSPCCCLTGVPGKAPGQGGVRRQRQAEEGRAGRRVQGRVQRGAGGTERTGSSPCHPHRYTPSCQCHSSTCGPSHSSSMALLATDGGPDPRGAGPPRIAAARQVLGHRQRTTVPLRGWGRRRRGSRP